MRFPFQLAQDKDFDAVGFGTNAVDFLIQVPEYPAFNSKIEFDGYVQAPGGEIASAMVGLQRLGMKTGYAGRFGGDQAGDLGLQSLIDEGVDTDFAESVSDAKTQIAFILIDRQSGERTIIWQRDKKLAYAETDAPVQAAARGKILHLTPHDTGACIRLAGAARAEGVIVSIDIDNLFDRIGDLLMLVDVCIASAEFSGKLLGITDAKQALREMRSRFGCKVVGLTLGAAGSIVLCEDSIVETPGFDVPGGCVDTTGAGDAFRAGFLFGLLNGQTVSETARIANAVAALKCRSFGARAALPTQKELNLFLRKF